MKILKTNKVKDISLSIRYRCDMCGTKVLLENGSDIILIRHKFGYETTLSDFIFGYRCPNCGELISLSDSKNCRITKKLQKCGVTIKQYNAATDHVRSYLIWRESMNAIMEKQGDYENFKNIFCTFPLPWSTSQS